MASAAQHKSGGAAGVGVCTPHESGTAALHLSPGFPHRRRQPGCHLRNPADAAPARAAPAERHHHPAPAGQPARPAGALAGHRASPQLQPGCRVPAAGCGSGTAHPGVPARRKRRGGAGGRRRKRKRGRGWCELGAPMLLVGEGEAGLSGPALPCAWHHIIPGHLLGSGKPVLMGVLASTASHFSGDREGGMLQGKGTAQAVHTPASMHCTAGTANETNARNPCNYALKAKARGSKGGCVASSSAHAQTFVKTPGFPNGFLPQFPPRQVSAPTHVYTKFLYRSYILLSTEFFPSCPFKPWLVSQGIAWSRFSMS